MEPGGQWHSKGKWGLMLWGAGPRGAPKEGRQKNKKKIEKKSKIFEKNAPLLKIFVASPQ